MSGNGRGIVVDGSLIEKVYSDTKAFGAKMTAFSKEIETQAKWLGNPSNFEGLSGGQGDECVAAMKAISKAGMDMSVRAQQIAKFVDTKLEGMANLKKSTAGFEDNKSKINQATSQIKK